MHFKIKYLNHPLYNEIFTWLRRLEVEEMTSSSTEARQSGEAKEALGFTTFWFSSSLCSGYVSFSSSSFSYCDIAVAAAFLFSLFFSYSLFAVFILLLQLLIFICALFLFFSLLKDSLLSVFGRMFFRMFSVFSVTVRQNL